MTVASTARRGLDRARLIDFLSEYGFIVFFVIMVVGPLGVLPWGGGTAVASNECYVDSMESPADGYTPMVFSSEDPEMTVIWVFSEEVDGSIRGEGPGAD